LKCIERICRDAGMTAVAASRHARVVYAAYVGYGHLRRANPGFVGVDRAELRYVLRLLDPS
jgi:hypothetical protein